MVALTCHQQLGNARRQRCFCTIARGENYPQDKSESQSCYHYSGNIPWKQSSRDTQQFGHSLFDESKSKLCAAYAHPSLLTSGQIVYLPDKPTAELESFSAPLLNLHDTHLTVPWFGPNAWQALLQPVPGGNITATQAAIELKLTFKEGGAPDFHSSLERIKERLQQVVSVARENNLSGPGGGGLPGNVDLENVHLDQLPSYQESGRDRIAPEDAEVTRASLESPVTRSPESRRPGSPAQPIQPLSDAPPGYEETQQQSIQAELDRRLAQ